MTYLLGTAIASYLGIRFSKTGFWLGLGWVVLVQISFTLLAEVFKPVNEPAKVDDKLSERINFRNLLLLIAGTALLAAVMLTLVMLRLEQFTLSTILFLSATFFLSLAYSVPPFRLIYTGFGEFVRAILLSFLPASIAFLLQSGEYHRLVGFVTFPLILLGLGWLIVLDFPSYSEDEKYEHLTLLRRMGWERAITLHNALLIFAYITFLLAPLIGIGLNLIYPALFTLPFALFQILLIRGIARGAPANWRLITATSTCVFGLTIYFVTLTFWLR
jgi:1,4-dihydroxy-2-naphthoate octaprenyltransferase